MTLRAVHSVLALLFLSGFMADMHAIDNNHSMGRFSRSAQPFGEHQRLTQALASEGFTIDVHQTGEILSQVLRGYDVLVINGPFGGSSSVPTAYPFSTAEVQAIVRYVEEGHGLLLNAMQSNAAIAIANQLSREFGVEFLATKVHDPTDFFSQQFNPIVREMISHPITNGVGRFVLEEPGTFTISGNSSQVAWADDDAYLIPPRLVSSIPLVVTANRGAGRAVFVHDTDWFHDDFLGVLERRAQRQSSACREHHGMACRPRSRAFRPHHLVRIRGSWRGRRPVAKTQRGVGID